MRFADWSAKIVRSGAVAACVTLGGCASYHALPLQPGADQRLADLKVDAAQMPTQPLRHHRYDPSDGLDVTEVAMLAVANNPDLRTMRDDLGIARAQAFAAGLLPDPTVTAEQDFVTGGSGGPNATSPFSFGISWDVSKLLTLSSREHAARWNTRQVDLQLLWAEWQTIAQARLLFSQLRSGQANVARLQREVDALQPLQQHVLQALNGHQISYDVAATGLNAGADARRQLSAARVQLNQDRHDLRQLLGLAPGVALHLVGPAPMVAPDTAQVDAALKNLPERRPDLLALKAGYASQNENLREAILGQYPALNVGFVRTRDNSAVYTSGVSIGLTLPLFDRNRGNIAIARASRLRLHDAYAARLLTTRNDVDRLRHELALDQQALPLLTAHAARLDQALRNAERSWHSRQLDWPSYVAIRSSALSADQQRITLQQNTVAAGIALQTLLGADWSSTANTSSLSDRP